MDNKMPSPNEQPPSPNPKQPNFWKILSIVFGILVLGMVGVYAGGNFEILKQYVVPPLIPPPPATLPVISGISPVSAPPRTEVTITGSGFAPTGNAIHFGTEIIPDIPSVGGKTLVFTVPSGCRGGSPCAPGTYTTVLPGNYEIYVTNEKGASNKAVFTVIKAEGCTPTCTADIREMCSLDGKEKQTVPSYCSCGVLDAQTLISQGWRDCR